MVPTPTRSPTACLVTAEPTSVHGAGDLVTDDLRVGDRAPVAADGVDVGVADAGVGDLDQHIVGSDIAAGDGGRHRAARWGRGRRRR